MGPGRASKGVQLFEVSRVQVCGRFEGRVGRLFQRPVGAQVTAGQRPAAQERLTDALDQGQPETGMGRVRGVAGIGGTVAGIAFRPSARITTDTPTCGGALRRSDTLPNPMPCLFPYRLFSLH